MKKIILLALAMCSLYMAKADENLVTAKPVTIEKGVDIESDNCGTLEVYIKGTEKVSATNFDIWLPTSVLTFDPDLVYQGDILPSVTKKGKTTYSHSINVQAYPTEKQTLAGYTKYLVNIFATDGSFLNETEGLLISFDLGSVADGADGVYPIYINNQALSITSTNILANVPEATTYVIYGTVSTPTFTAEGIIGSSVIESIPAGTTIDFSNATAVYGTCSNAVNAKYTRTISNQWNTVCLPYTVSSGNGVQYYTVTGVQDDALVVEATATLAAGTPALMKSAEGATSYSADVDGVSLSAVAQNSGSMIGTFEPINVTDADAYYIKSNKFYLCNDNFNVAAFKAYFKTGSGAKSSVLSIEEGNTTSINAANLSENDINEVYGINGVRKNYMQNGVNIVKMSDGKVMKVIVK